MDYCVTVLQKLLLLSYVMSWPVVLAYPETAQHSIISALGKNHSTKTRKKHPANSRKNHSGNSRKTTVAKWQTGWATLIEPY